MSERDFSDSSVVNASLSNAEGAGSVSSWGDPTSWEDPTMCHRQKKAKHKKQRNKGQLLPLQINAGGLVHMPSLYRKGHL